MTCRRVSNLPAGSHSGSESMPEDNEEVSTVGEGRRRQYRGRMAWLVKAFSALIPLYCIFYVLNITGFYFHTHFFTSAFLALFLFFVLALVFLLYPATKKAPLDHLPWYDLLLMMRSSRSFWLSCQNRGKPRNKLRCHSDIDLQAGMIPACR